MHDAKVRIFVSSPSDLDHERALLKEICARLRQEYLSYFEVQPVLWEEEALTADRNFQDGILRPADCDIVVVVLWTRLGTPLPEEPYQGMTGTQWEFVNAVEASARSGQPEVLVYKKTKPKLVDITNAEATREALEDRRRLEDFFQANFFNPDLSFRRAFRTFDSDAGFRDLVEGQLRKLLNRRISAEKRAISGVGDWRGSPFRPDGPYDLGDGRIFTGRESEARDLLARLPGRRFLLVSGPSGCGKTSLVRAGVLPRLARPFLVEGVAGCRIALVDPGSSAGADPIAALAEGLCSRNALGQTLAGFGLDQAALAGVLARDPGAAAAQVAAALDVLGREQRGRTGVAEGELRLALVLDPLDDLLAGPLGPPGPQPGPADAVPDGDAGLDPGPGPDASALSVSVLIAAVTALAATGRVWVIGVLGNARLGHLHPLLPLLAAPAPGTEPGPAGALDGQAWYRLPPPAAARVRQVVEIPSRVAGIEVEGYAPGTDLSLVDLLEAEAGPLAHWPPLLEATLERIYRIGLARAAGAAPSLVAADYRTAGGIAGVVLARAEAVWAGLDPAVQAALPRLCRALIALDGVRPGLRAGELTLLEADPACRALVAALAAARLVVLDGERDPLSRSPCPPADYSLAGYLRGALKATGAQWRARLNPARALRELTAEAPGADHGPAVQVQGQAQAQGGEAVEDWSDWADWRPRAVFAHPVLLTRWAPVRDWLADPSHRETLRLRHHVARRALLWRRTDCNREHLLGEAGFAAARRLGRDLAGEIEPLEAAYLAESERHLRFERQRNQALRALGVTLVVLLALATTAAFWALDASRQARVALHRSLLDAAGNDMARGNSPQALMRALAAAPLLPQEATDTLSRALTGNRLIAMAQGGPEAAPGPDHPVISPAFSDDGERLITADHGNGVDVWRLRDARLDLEAHLGGDGLDLRVLAFAGRGDQARPLAGGPGGVWRLPAAPGAAPDYPCGVDAEHATAVDPSGRYVAMAHGYPNESAPQPGSQAAGPLPTGAAPGPGPGRHGVCVLDLERPGTVLLDLPLHQAPILGLDFAPDGRRLVTASADGTARVLDLAQGAEVLSLPPEGRLRRPIHRAVFDPSGSGRIALAGGDGQVRVYDAEGKPLAALQDVRNGPTTVRLHASAVLDLAFARDGRYLVAGDDDGQVVRWDPLHPDTAQILGQHDLAVDQVRLAPPHGEPDAEPLVLTASQDGTARLWGLYTGRAIAAFSQDAAVTDARFSTDGSRVLTASDLDGSARVWSVHRLPRIAQTLALPDHAGPVAVDPSDAGASLNFAVGGYTGGLEVWRLPGRDPGAEPQRLWLLEGHRGRVRRLAFAPSGRWLASAAADGTARVWDIQTGTGCTMDVGDAKEVGRVLFGPDEDWLLTASDDPRQPVRLWSWDGTHCLPLDGGPGFAPARAQTGARVQAAAVIRARDGATLAATGDDAGLVRVLRRAPNGTWQQVCDLAAHRGPVLDLTLDPDGARLASGGDDGGVVLTRIGPEGCSPQAGLDGHTAAVQSVRFAPDGSSLVSASQDGSARVWGPDGTPLATLAGHRARVGQAEYSPDGHWILTGSRDGDLRLWRTPDRPQGRVEASFLTLPPGRRGVTGVAFSPDGNRVLAGYWRNAAQLWRLWDPGQPPADLVATWGPQRARLALVQEAERYRRDNRLDLRAGR